MDDEELFRLEKAARAVLVRFASYIIHNRDTISICYHLIAVTTKWNNRWTKIRGWDSVLTIKKTATSLPIMSKHIRWWMCIYITIDIMDLAYNGWHSHSLCIRTSPLWYFSLCVHVYIWPWILWLLLHIRITKYTQSAIYTAITAYVLTSCLRCLRYSRCLSHVPVVIEVSLVSLVPIVSLVSLSVNSIRSISCKKLVCVCMCIFDHGYEGYYFI